jgi:hypothetical protein
MRNIVDTAMSADAAGKPPSRTLRGHVRDGKLGVITLIG